MTRHARRALAVALCALVGHAMLYRSLEPNGSAHGYFAWYAPMLALLSLAALVVLPLVVAAATFTDRQAGRLLAAALPEREPGSATREIVRLAASAAVFLAVQESLERSLASGEPRLAHAAPATLLLIGVVLTVAAGAIVAVERTVAAIAAPRTRPVAARNGVVRWSATVASPLRRSPLSLHAGLRAPPLVV